MNEVSNAAIIMSLASILITLTDIIYVRRMGKKYVINHGYQCGLNWAMKHPETTLDDLDEFKSPSQNKHWSYGFQEGLKRGIEIRETEGQYSAS